METKFQTSFIPKKPVVTTAGGEHHGPSGTSVLMFVAMLIFIGSIGWAVGATLGVGYYTRQQEDYKINLAENEKQFKTPLIEELSRANTKIDLAKQLIKNHVAVSEALTIIAALTAEKVKFTDFEFSADAKNASSYRIKMRGLADSFNSIAFQSDVFGKSLKYGTNKVVKNPILSDLTVDTNGDVKFNFSAELAAPDISYENVLTHTLQAEGSLPAPTQ
jgi:hypothetical protein